MSKLSAAKTRALQRRPLKPIIFCTTASLASAMASPSRASSAQLSHTFLLFVPTFTVWSSSTSSPQALQTGMLCDLSERQRLVKPRVLERAKAAKSWTSMLENPVSADEYWMRQALAEADLA